MSEKSAGIVDTTARAAADIGHLWTHPVLLDGARYRERYGEVPCTGLEQGVAATVAWHREHPDARLQG